MHPSRTRERATRTRRTGSNWRQRRGVSAWLDWCGPAHSSISSLPPRSNSSHWQTTSSVSLASVSSYHPPSRHISEPFVSMSSEPPTNLPLPQFYARTLTSLLPLFDDVLSPSSPGAQDLLRTALDELYLIARMIVSLGVFSENESAEELGDGELVFMTLGWVIGEAEAKAGLGGMEDRKGALQRSDVSRIESHPQSTSSP